jgi:hypothetical protein
MSSQNRELYRSPNGDAWYLCRDEAGRVYVQHEANLPSGGNVTQIELRAFLARGAAGPEHQALLHLIGTLVESRTPVRVD